jgi:hypothetical protein
VTQRRGLVIAYLPQQPKATTGPPIDARMRF